MTVYFSCKDIKLSLSAYFDGEVNSEEKKKIENHLLRCPECQKEFELIKKTSVCLKNYFQYSTETPVISEENSQENISENVFKRFIYFQRKEKVAYFAAISTIVAAIFYLSTKIFFF